MRSASPRARRARPSATTPSTWKNFWRTRATSNSRCWPTVRATPSIWANATARYSAATFEFLYENGEFYFIEMNTRLQVEHPVTEMIAGVDVVKEQLKIAAGQPLSFRQKDIKFHGHAIECRINAEDAATFVPSPGMVTLYHPPGGPGIRVDSHLYSGYAVPPDYDSMIGKLIAFGDDRGAALARMRTALTEMVVDGIKTNILLHRDILVLTAFLAGVTIIHFLEIMLNIWGICGVDSPPQPSPC